MASPRLLLLRVALTLALAAWVVETGADQPAIEARIARIEAHLLPGMIIKDAPPQAMSMADRMRFHKTPGVSVAVINDGVVEWTRGYGVRQADGTEPVTARTRFQAASISKPVAALAALTLVQRGRLALDEEVNAKLTSWKVPENDQTKEQKVTLRRLLSHSAGLTVHGFPGYASDAPLPTLGQVLDGVKPANTPPIRVDILPGSQYRYSGGGYTVLQRLVIDVTRQRFPQFMREAALDPVGMADSTYEQPLPAALRQQAATAHDGNGKPIPGRFHTYPEMAAAGLWTTPGDLARFAVEVQRAVAGRSKVLTSATAKDMLTAQKESYGLGLVVEGSGRSARFSHGGSNEGFRCQMVAYVETGQGAVVMTNAARGSRLAQEILRAIAKEYGWPEYVRVKEKTLARVDPSIYQAYAGQYEIAPGRTVQIRVVGSKLQLTDGSQSAELLPESETRFFELVNETDVEFVKGPDGVVAHLVLDGQTKARRIGSRP